MNGQHPVRKLLAVKASTVAVRNVPSKGVKMGDKWREGKTSSRGSRIEYVGYVTREIKYYSHILKEAPSKRR